MTEQTPTIDPAAPVGPAPAIEPDAALAAETAKRLALETQVEHMAGVMLAAIPENLKALIPSELGPAAQVAWYLRAKETGVFSAPVIPGTDQGKPKITPREPDLSTLPPVARMARAYK